MEKACASALMTAVHVKYVPSFDASVYAYSHATLNLTLPLSKWRNRSSLVLGGASCGVHVPTKFIVCASQTRCAIDLAEEEREKWDACKDALSSMKFSADEADAIISKAFGWVNSPYWSEEKIKTVPEIDAVNELLSYLQNLGLSDGDIYKLLKKFPEVLGCDLKESKKNIDTLERQWGINGNSLRSLLLRNPKVLGYNVDCRGDCVAKCTRCWARF